MRDTITTNELKKGTEIRLRNGFTATLADNKKGNIRNANVRGYRAEFGSVYAHDIISAQVDGRWLRVEHTPAQLKCKAMVKALGF